MNLRKRLLSLAGCAVVVWLTGCSAGPGLSENPSAPVDLSGSWLLDVDRSDDVEAMMRDAFAQVKRQADKKSRNEDSRPPKESNARPRDAKDRSRPEGRDAAPDEMAMLRPDELIFADRRMTIKQSAHLVEVTSKRAGYRRYKIGTPISRTGPGGTFEINSGWNGTDFYAVSEGRQDIDIVERYSLSADGNELTREMTLDAKMLDDKVVVTQIYYPETE